MRNTSTSDIVVPIERGKALKSMKKQVSPVSNSPKQDPAIRRLMQCVEMLAELSKDIARNDRTCGE